MSAEMARLRFSATDWKLPTNDAVIRTRHGGHGRPKLKPSEESEDSSWSMESSDGRSSSDDDNLTDMKKPTSTRVIVEVESLKTTIVKNCRCRQCNGEVEISLKTVCLATSVILRCQSPSCGYIYYSEPPAQVDLEEDDLLADKRERSTDYAINILYVLGFISCGDGCTEAARLLGLLGLPNDTTMETRSFGIIEDRISRKVQEVTEEILMENLIEEAKLSMEASTVQDMNDFHLWKHALNNSDFVLCQNKYPLIMCSFDMRWQQRGSAHRYNSQSGHALLIGGRSRKPIAFVVKSKRCNYCLLWRKKTKADLDDEESFDSDLIPPHNCTINHEGSSGSMEPQACLEMVVTMFEKNRCIIEKICADDDTSIRALVKWSNADYMRVNNTTEPPMAPITKGPNKGKLQVRPDRGKLPSNVPEPTFVADPNHRKKLLTGELLSLVSATVDKKMTMTKNDMVRIGKNFAYMVRQLPKMNESDYEEAGFATLEHHFDNHQFCGDWCRRKHHLAAGENNNNNNDRFYRCKEKDAQLYLKLQEIVNKYITFERLKEVAHGMDTNVNESFNNTFSWLAPKNKVYCGTQSLMNRLSMGIGIQGLGLLQYFRRLFQKLGVIITPNILHFLSVKQTKRAKRIHKVKQSETKKLWLQTKYEQLKKDEAIAKKERAKCEGYSTGINLQEEEEQSPPATQTNNTRNKRTSVVCKHCGKKGHSTTRSKKCLKHKNNNNQQPPVQQAEAQAPDPAPQQLTDDAVETAANDIDKWDAMPLDAADDDDDCDFYECQSSFESDSESAI